MRKKTTPRKVVKKGSSKTKKRSTKKSTLPKLKKTSIPQLPTPPPMIRISRSSGEVNKPLIIGIISVVVLVIIFFLAKGTFVGKAYFVGDEGSAGFVSIAELPFNTDNVDFLQTEINAHWGYDNYLVLGAKIPVDKQSVGVEVLVNLGGLELKNMDFANGECNNAVEIMLGPGEPIDQVWEFVGCTLEPGNKLRIEVATLNWQNAVSGEFDVAKLILKEEPSLVGVKTYEIFIEEFKVLDLEPNNGIHENLINTILNDENDKLQVKFRDDADIGNELNDFEDPCPYDLENACPNAGPQPQGGPDQCAEGSIEYDGVCMPDDPIIILVKDANGAVLVGNPVVNTEHTIQIRIKPEEILPVNHKVIITVSQDNDQKAIFINTKPSLQIGGTESFTFTYVPSTATPMSVEALVWNGYPATNFVHNSFENKTQAYGN